MADDNTNSQQQPPGSGPALERLNALVGEWAIEGTGPTDPPLKVRGRAAFEWLTEGSFLVERWDVAHPDFPDGIAIIGRTTRWRHFASTTSTRAASPECTR